MADTATKEMVLDNDLSFETLFMALVRIPQGYDAETSISNFTRAARLLPAARRMIGKLRGFLREHENVSISTGFIHEDLLDDPENDADYARFKRIMLNVDGEEMELCLDD